MFKILLTIIIIGYVLYYGYMIVSDVFLNKSTDLDKRAEEVDIDISEEMENFESVDVSRDKAGNAPAEATVIGEITNTGGLGIDELLLHVDDFAENGSFGSLAEMKGDWRVLDAA